MGPAAESGRFICIGEELCRCATAAIFSISLAKTVVTRQSSFYER
jgi:hypothetical protein